MKKKILAGMLCIALAMPMMARGEEQTGQNAYIVVKSAVLYEEPDAASEEVAEIPFGNEIKISNTESIEKPDETQDAGTVLWHQVSYKENGGTVISGYMMETNYSEISMLQRKSSFTVAIGDGDILDYPGKKDGEVIGELLEYDNVQMTASVGTEWSQIVFKNRDDKEEVGYVLNSILEGQEAAEGSNHTEGQNPSESGSTSEEGNITETEAASDENSTAEDTTEESTTEENTTEESGTLHEGSGQGVFAEAVEGVADEAGMDANGVQIGTPVGVGSNATLTPLGTFRITHYCPCSICCGPYTDGITSTGVTATTNHTIAVEPHQIPYGSKVVINGQVYVAEDCGGGIKTNCIDIYVASHAEGEAKGVFYTDVYLLNEG